MKTILLILILTAGALHLYAQNASSAQAVVFTVFGNVETQRNGKMVVLKQKDLIQAKEMLSVSKKAVIKLITYDFHFIEINKPGTYTLEALIKALPSGSTGITERYLHLIWHELFQPHGSGGHISADAIGGAIGGAGRGCELFISPIHELRTDRDTILIQWHKTADTRWYRFSAASEDKSSSFAFLTGDTSMMLLTAPLKKNEPVSYELRVNGATGCSDARLRLHLLTTAALQEQTAEIVKSVPLRQDLFLYYLQVSSRLGENGFYQQAYEYYLKAEKILNP